MNSPRSKRRLLIAAIAALLAAPAVAVPATASGSHSPAPAVRADVFRDTFDGPAGSGVDGSKWQLETGDNVNNHERQYYTSGTNNAALDGDGHLVITAKQENPDNYQCWYGTCQYTSARMNTSGKFSAQYGHVEARMKVPRGQGMWPAFWMLGDGGAGWPQQGEIDVMENVGFEPNTVHGTIHGPGYSGDAGIGAGYSLPGGAAFADDFHTFAIDWAPDSITWSVDGNVYQTRTPADVNGNEWVFNHSFFLILNLAVGGYWPGDPDGSTSFPQQLVVDEVSVTTADSAAALKH
ncbi:family 16 glycosylhydrolase [Streptomyces sp. NPDC050560]|uniref:glycoside hydrolase family 16 protein n=1 Tax=Streptomyces sp. NPDC050560 TaxID=3365630 RepID=UPI0037944270